MTIKIQDESKPEEMHPLEKYGEDYYVPGSAKKAWEKKVDPRIERVPSSRERE